MAAVIIARFMAAFDVLWLYLICNITFHSAFLK